jgi:hypothetical protein
MVYPLVKLLGIGSTIPRVYKLTVRLPSSDIFSMKKLIYYCNVYIFVHIICLVVNHSPPPPICQVFI